MDTFTIQSCHSLRSIQSCHSWQAQFLQVFGLAVLSSVARPLQISSQPQYYAPDQHTVQRVTTCSRPYASCVGREVGGGGETCLPYLGMESDRTLCALCVGRAFPLRPRLRGPLCDANSAPQPDFFFFCFRMKPWTQFFPPPLFFSNFDSIRESKGDIF